MGRTTLETRVPVSTLMSAAMRIAVGPTFVPAGGTMVPPTTAPGACGVAVRVRSMPCVGPPVITGSPTAFSQVEVPSMIVAKSAYACVGSTVAASMRTEKSMGNPVGPLITCWPITAPASGAAVVSMIVTIATAAGVKATLSR